MTRKAPATTRSIFLFGLCVGAWLNMWLHGWAAFIFAYVLVAISIASVAYDQAKIDDPA